MINLPKFSLEQIDKGVYEAIRKIVVSNGYFPPLVQSEIEFNYYKSLILDSGKKVVEVFPVGYLKRKQELVYNGIYIERTDSDKGDFGTNSIQFIEKNIEGVKSYDKVKTDYYPENLTYTITILTDTTAYERLMYGFLNEAFGKRKLIKGINSDRTETDYSFWLMYQGFGDTSSDEFTEKQYRYKAKDLRLNEPELIEAVPEMTSIEIEIKPSQIVNSDSVEPKVLVKQP